MRVVRMRPGLIFKREAATDVRRLFAGPLLPGALLRPSLIPVVPDHPRLRFRAVHSLDVGDAHRRALLSNARGAFNLAAGHRSPRARGDLPGATSSDPGGAAPGRRGATFRLRLQPFEPGWLDMGLAVPLMDCSRAQAALGWEPRRSAVEALCALIAGMRAGDDLDTPPPARVTSGPARVRGLLTGLGQRA